MQLTNIRIQLDLFHVVSARKFMHICFTVSINVNVKGIVMIAKPALHYMSYAMDLHIMYKNPWLHMNVFVHVEICLLDHGFCAQLLFLYT